MHIIYYFTGTGNSLQIAQDIGEQLKEAQLKKIADYEGEEIQGETVGIVFPVYDWGIPLIVERFLKKIRVDSRTYIYGVTNFNGLPGMALNQCQEILQSKGLELSAGYLIPMPGNYIPMYGPRSEKKQQEMFAYEKKKVDEIVPNVLEKKKLEIERKHPLLTKLLGNKMYSGIKSFQQADQNFVLSESCTGCGLCEKGCPVHNIAMEDGKPVWQHHCEMCLACLQYCPKRAIEYGDKSVKRERYHNPNVKREL